MGTQVGGESVQGQCYPTAYVVTVTLSMPLVPFPLANVTYNMDEKPDFNLSSF